MDFDEAASTQMSFGKWKGRKLDEVPLSYLDWLIGQAWFLERVEYRAVEVYLSHPSIKRLLEEEIPEEQD